jgi:3'-phosphoadenosine 5'-phosphosulfate sulfotransferase (PAPS reductase)/FAD synthetase
MEWEGVKTLAAEQAARYGVRFEVVRNDREDLLAHVERRGRWPSPGQRYCTSDHKTKPVVKLITRLVAEWNAKHQAGLRKKDRRKVRVLNCLGLRAQESPKRRDLDPVSVDPATNKTVRDVTRWLPIHSWTEDEVWATIRSKGLAYHKAYDLGMPRLSCIFCFFAPPEALLLAGYWNPERLAEYAAMERKTGQYFFKGKELVQIEAKLNAGYIPQGKVDATLWSQCA